MNVSQCSRPCDTGAQRRDVRCILESQQMSTGCNETNKPPTRRSCNIQKCPGIMFNLRIGDPT